MFGISFIELFLVFILIIIFVKPSEYSSLLQKLKEFYRLVKKAYESGKKELEKVKKEIGFDDLEEINLDLKNRIEKADLEIKKITGDDGKEYEAYDIEGEMTPLDKK